MKLAWGTDVHLNFLELGARELFYQNILKTDASAVLITGDIAEAPTVSEILIEMTQRIDKPIYFVLGNHDYYQSNVVKVRQDITTLCNTNSQLHWLPAIKAVDLTKNVVMVGEDCWADGRYGNYTDSEITLNDSHMIQDLLIGSMIGKYKLLNQMQKLADLDAIKLKQNLQLAIRHYSPKRVIALVHIPPFKESCIHEGKIISDDYLPFLASKISGDVLLETAESHPEVDFLVLCGHTHNSSYYQPLNNLTVKTGGAKDRHPFIQEVIEI